MSSSDDMRTVKFSAARNYPFAHMMVVLTSSTTYRNNCKSKVIFEQQMYLYILMKYNHMYISWNLSGKRESLPHWNTHAIFLSLCLVPWVSLSFLIVCWLHRCFFYVACNFVRKKLKFLLLVKGKRHLKFDFSIGKWDERSNRNYRF